MAIKTLGNVAEGTVFKLEEGSALAEFVVARHNYESSLNGTGHTLIVRKTVLTEKREWAHYSTMNAPTSVNWKSHSTLRTWLEGTYSQNFSAKLLAKVKPLTIRYDYSSGTGQLSGAKFYVPRKGDDFADAAKSVIAGQSYWTRSAQDDDYSTNDDPPQTYEYGEVYAVSKNSGDWVEQLWDSRGVLPCFALLDDMILGEDGVLRVNTAPSTPGSISVPSSIMGGTSITVSWSASTDAENNLAGYTVERSTNGGSSWSQIYQGTATSISNSIAFGTSSVMYRVKAYDSCNEESGWKVSPQVTVVNNHAPSAPASITVPSTVNGGSTLVISWTAASDADNNLSGYILERSTNGGSSYTQVYKGSALTYTDTITKGWTTVTYRVKAYDSYNAQSGYTTSAKRTVNNNTAPTITTASAADLGTKASGFTVSYSVDDADTADTLTVTEKLDGTIKRSFTATRKASNSFAVTGEYFQKITNGKHTLTVTVTDGKATATKTFTFTKAVTSASVTLTTPLKVTGSIPDDATYKVEVTNNALDDSPVWQDATVDVKKGKNILFTNTTAAKGAAFNFRVSIARGPSGVGGYIEAVSGAFQ